MRRQGFFKWLASFRKGKALAIPAHLTKSPPMNDIFPLAVLADIHGNALALRAVLADANKRGIDRFVNLGDTFYGPLDPGGTWEILQGMEMPAVLGNQDRILLEDVPGWVKAPAFRAAVSALGEQGLGWLRSLSTTSVIDGDILLCHGTPKDDMKYLLEDISTGLPAMRDCREIAENIHPEADGCTLVLAGHSHHQGLVNCAGVTVANPGSVGLPAYDDDNPPHIMASGSPHARYGIVSRTDGGWDVEFVKVEYDWQAAADMARANGREDWAQWLLTGTAW